MFPEWLEEIEHRCVRPMGWGGCWFIQSRRGRAGHNPTRDGAVTFKPNPSINVMVFDGVKGWHNKKVLARPYIARMFFEFEFEASNLRRSYRRHRVGPGGREYEEVVHVDQPVSSWKISTTCDNDACINPSHFVFLYDRAASAGGDAKSIRPGAGYRKNPRGLEAQELRERGWYGPGDDSE